MDNEIDLKADFLTFKNQIINKFGQQYFDQAEIFFERAMKQAEQGLIHSAIADGKFALDLTHYSNDQTGIQYLIGFLSQLHCDIGQISISKAYYELGLKLLDTNDRGYEDDKQLFANLKELIDGESWKGNIEDKMD
jgi:hypothetical protein